VTYADLDKAEREGKEVEDGDDNQMGEDFNIPNQSSSAAQKWLDFEFNSDTPASEQLPPNQRIAFFDNAAYLKVAFEKYFNFDQT